MTSAVLWAVLMLGLAAVVLVRLYGLAARRHVRRRLRAVARRGYTPDELDADTRDALGALETAGFVRATRDGPRVVRVALTGYGRLALDYLDGLTLDDTDVSPRA